MLDRETFRAMADARARQDRTEGQGALPSAAAGADRRGRRASNSTSPCRRSSAAPQCEQSGSGFVEILSARERAEQCRRAPGSSERHDRTSTASTPYSKRCAPARCVRLRVRGATRRSCARDRSRRQRAQFASSASPAGGARSAGRAARRIRAWWPTSRRERSVGLHELRGGRGAAHRRPRRHRRPAQPRRDPADGRTRRAPTGGGADPSLRAARRHRWPRRRRGRCRTCGWRRSSTSPGRSRS